MENIFLYYLAVKEGNIHTCSEQWEERFPWVILCNFVFLQEHI